MSVYQTRRATVDDRPALIDLWHSVDLPAETLAASFTDFQVAEDESGKLVAAIALQMEGASGRIHAEAYADFGLTDQLRPLLWQRLRLVAQGYGLFRLWTEEKAPWWKKDAGFEIAGDSIKQKLPLTFGSPASPWMMLRLREETPDDTELEAKIAQLHEQQRVRLSELTHRAKIVRVVVITIVALIWIFSLILLFNVIRGRR